jgi:hypothetical protein
LAEDEDKELYSDGRVLKLRAVYVEVRGKVKIGHDSE